MPLMFVPMIATLAYFSTTFTARGLVTATINDQVYTSSLPAGWTLTIENANETRVGGSGAASRKANQSGTNQIGQAGFITVGYTVSDTRTIGALDRVFFYYTKTRYGSASLNNFVDTVTSASSGICDELFEMAALEGSGMQEHQSSETKKMSQVVLGSSYMPGTPGSYDFQITSKQVFSARATNNGSGTGTNTVVVSQGDSAFRVVPVSVKVVSKGLVTLSVPSFLTEVAYLVTQGTDVLDDAGQDNIASGQVTIPFDEYASGTYQIYVTAKSSLRRKLTLNYTAGTNVAFKPITMYFGDIDKNNTITQEEVDFVQSQIGKSSTSPDWYKGEGNPHLWTPSQADINGDGVVSSLDYNLVSGNVGRVGD